MGKRDFLEQIHFWVQEGDPDLENFAHRGCAGYLGCVRSNGSYRATFASCAHVIRAFGLSSGNRNSSNQLFPTIDNIRSIYIAAEEVKLEVEECRFIRGHADLVLLISKPLTGTILEKFAAKSLPSITSIDYSEGACFTGLTISLEKKGQNTLQPGTFRPYHRYLCKDSLGPGKDNYSEMLELERPLRAPKTVSGDSGGPLIDDKRNLVGLHARGGEEESSVIIPLYGIDLNLELITAEVSSIAKTDEKPSPKTPYSPGNTQTRATFRLQSDVVKSLGALYSEVKSEVSDKLIDVSPEFVPTYPVAWGVFCKSIVLVLDHDAKQLEAFTSEIALSLKAQNQTKDPDFSLKPFLCRSLRALVEQDWERVKDTLRVYSDSDCEEDIQRLVALRKTLLSIHNDEEETISKIMNQLKDLFERLLMMVERIGDLKSDIRSLMSYEGEQAISSWLNDSGRSVDTAMDCAVEFVASFVNKMEKMFSDRNFSYDRNILGRTTADLKAEQ